MSTEHFRLPAGWYADPETSGDRWWNGSQWTSHVRPSVADASDSVDLSVLEGQPAAAWSASDYPLATVIGDGHPPVAAVSVTGSQPPSGPAQPPIAPGWYPDPQGLPAQRWWDGARWSTHTAPAPRPSAGYPGGGTFQPGGYSATYPPAAYPPYGGTTVVYPPSGGTTVVMVAPPKSVGVALVLTFFFGPLGMFYSTVSGALVMLAVSFFGGLIVGLMTFGLGWVVWAPLVWFASMVWGCLAAAQQQSPVINNYR